MKGKTVKGNDKKHEDVEGMKNSTALLPPEDRSICF